MSTLRAYYGIALVATVALGIASRRITTGAFVLDKSAGDVLYAVAVSLVLATTWPRWSVAWRSTVALALCSAVEAFQATGIPARHSDRLIVRWLIGTTFAWHDLACYVVGVALVGVVENLRSDHAGRAGPQDRRGSAGGDGPTTRS